ANWEKGFGDFGLRPDLDTLRVLPWQPGAAMVLCDLHHHGGQLVEEAPRSVLRRQVDRLASPGLACAIASELEFFLFNNTYAAAFASKYIGLTPSSDYRIDYHTMQPTRDEAIFRQFLGGLMKYSPQLSYFYAPTINAYKRYQPASWAPTKMAWAYDNRTVGFRVVGEGNSFRLENRMPGADANPYLAFAAMIAAG